jgi:hypothetical protein
MISTITRVEVLQFADRKGLNLWNAINPFSTCGFWALNLIQKSSCM